MESVPVLTKMFRGKTIWTGVVEVFNSIGHPDAHRVYAWAHETNDPMLPIRHVTVLHLHPVKSAEDAVKAAIMQEIKSLGTAEEN